MGEQVDLKELTRRLRTIFPDFVTMSEDMKTITVMGRVKVTPDGMAEGVGPVAERVKAVYDEYVREQSHERGEKSLASPDKTAKARNPFRCQHCGLRLTSGRVYRRAIGGSVMLFCCRQCADHEEAEVPRPKAK